MASFDPNKKYSDTDSLGAGRYLIALAQFERKTARASGAPYMRCRFKVIHGPRKGVSFFTSVSLDTTKSGAMVRLQRWCHAVGVTEAFDLDSDAAFGRAFMAKAFRAQVKTVQSGEYTNNEIERYLDESLSDAEIEAAEETWSAYASKRDDAGDYGDEYEEATNSSARGRRRADEGEDIPF